MTKDSPELKDKAAAEDLQDVPAGWTPVQEGLTNASGLALLLVEGHQPPALVITNNNSICDAIQSSPEHASLCDPFCGEAHARALEAGKATYYRCHAGLHCFAKPVQIDPERNMAVIGGRAFLAISDYRSAIERFRSGDLQALFKEETFKNVLFSTESKLEGLAANVDRSARDYRKKVSEETTALQLRQAERQAERQSEPTLQSDMRELRKEIERLQGQVEHQSRFAASLQYFLERISFTDPAETYDAILMNSKELLHAERASLFVFDEATNELTIRAAVGLPIDMSDVSTVRLGEGISGEAVEAGRPVMFSGQATAGMAPGSDPRRYKTKSFISYPITIRGRRVGVLNVTDKSGGGDYDQIDLNLLEIIAPQVAVALERAEWQEKATQFQLMSITDPLTGLPNRRYLEERLGEEVNRSKRYDQALSFLMIDIDDFKLYNDRNGHQAGDHALQMAAQGLKATLRSADVASRYGGEEFSVLLPQTSLHEAGVIAERMREKIERTAFTHAKAQPLGAVTISIGVSTFSPTIDTAEQVIWAADRALYQAKREGKNRISFFEDTTQKSMKANERG
jgi:diguanylate cyclase (GGDEF)-like protein